MGDRDRDPGGVRDGDRERARQDGPEERPGPAEPPEPEEPEEPEEPGEAGAPVDFDTFADWAEEIVDALPERLLDELTGGIQIDREARRHPGDPPGVYLLGEYITEPHLGRFIRIYYGSFVRTLRDEPADVWYDELEETILHELQHHIEALAGVDWLGLEDLRQLQELWEEARRGLGPVDGAGQPEGPDLPCNKTRHKGEEVPGEGCGPGGGDDRTRGSPERGDTGHSHPGTAGEP